MINSHVPTPAQMLALSDVYDRMPLGLDGNALMPGKTGMTWEEFKKTAHKEVAGPAIMVRWCGMWLGIEEDGHVHS